MLTWPSLLGGRRGRGSVCPSVDLTSNLSLFFCLFLPDKSLVFKLSILFSLKISNSSCPGDASSLSVPNSTATKR